MGRPVAEFSFEVLPRYLRISFNGSGITATVMYDSVDLYTRHFTYEEIHDVAEAVHSVFSSHPELLVPVGFVGIAVTSVLLWQRWRMRATAIAQNSVIFATHIPAFKAAEFDEFVASGKMQEELQEAWADKEKCLKEAFNDKSMVDKIMETLKGVEIGSVEKCDEAVAVKAIKASKEKLKSSTGDVAGKPSKHLLRPTALRVHPKRYVRNSAVVYFDDPNDDEPEAGNRRYVITAWDGDSGKPVVVKSEQTCVSVKNLKAGCSYLFKAEILAEGSKSSATYYDELFHTAPDWDAAFKSNDEEPGSGTSFDTMSLGEKTLKQKELKEKKMDHTGKTQSMDKVCQRFVHIFPTMSENRVEKFLLACSGNGVEAFADLVVMKKEGVFGKAFSKVLKPVEMGKLKAYLEDRYARYVGDWDSENENREETTSFQIRDSTVTRLIFCKGTEGPQIFNEASRDEKTREHVDMGGGVHIST